MSTIDLAGKRYLVMGVTNRHSLGWAIAEKLHAAGAELAFSYQGERLKGGLEKLTADFAGVRLAQCDVTHEEELEALFAGLGEAWGGSTASSTPSPSPRARRSPGAMSTPGARTG
jgi:enoyl-[acyl-carrier protein] reductase I